MNPGGQPKSTDYRAMTPFINPLNSQEYAVRRAKIEEAKRKLAEMELQMELEETIRQGREAEQRLAEMQASMAAEVPIVAELSSASSSGHYPNAFYSSTEEAPPLTARIEGEIRDTSPNSSRPPTQMPYYHQHNYPTTNQAQQAGFQAHTPQISTQPTVQRSSFSQTQSQPAARSQSSHAPYPVAPAFAVHGYQHFQQATSTPYQMYQVGQAYQPRSSYSEEYWAKQSQKYAAELAGAGVGVQTAPTGVKPQAKERAGAGAQTAPTGAKPQARERAGAGLQTAPAPAGVKPQASSFVGTGISQYAAQVQHQVASPAVPSVATVASSTQRPSLSSAEPQSTKRQSSGNPAQSAITKPEFIRQFQLVCNRNAQAIQEFLSSCPVAMEWWAEAARSVNPANFKDEGVVKMLNDMRNLTRTPIVQADPSASASTDVHVPTTVLATSVATAKPLPLPANPPSAQPPSTQPPSTQPPSSKQTRLGTKEDFLRYFHDRFQQADIDVIVEFLVRNLHFVPGEWRAALLSTLSPETLKEFGLALNRARASAGSKNVPATSAPMSDASSNPVPTVAQQSPIATASNVVAPATTHTMPGSSKSIPVPPRPSVTKSTQAKSTSAQPPMASASNSTVATTAAALATKTPTAPQVQASVSTAQVAPLVQPAASLNGVPPPLSIPGADGKVAHYAYDLYLKRYVRTDILNEHPVPSGSNAGIYYRDSVSKAYDGQQPPVLARQGMPASTPVPATILIPPATPPRREENGSFRDKRTPQQADKSRLAKDILRSLGINPPPAMTEEEEVADKETGVSSGNLPVTAEHQQETPPSRDISVDPLHEAPKETSLLQSPSNVLMEQVQQPQTQSPQSPIKEAFADNIIMDDEPTATSPEKATASLEFPLPTAPLCAASMSMDQEELTRGVDGMSLATDVHRSEPTREDGPIDSPISFPDLNEPLPPVLEPAGISSPAPSFRAQSPEQNEDNRSGVLPLFLPSPSASPAPHSQLHPETDDDVSIVEHILRDGSLSKSRVDLLDEDHARTSLRSVKRKKGQKVYVLVPPPPPALRRAIKKRKLQDQSIVSGSEEEEESKYNDFEQALIADCRVRMVERPCQWNGCDALMNSGENLYLHLKLHVQEASSQGPFSCRWQSCPRKFKLAVALEKHLQKHSYFPLPCPLANCSDVFDKPVEVMGHDLQHQQRESNRKLEMKQPPKPLVPKIPPMLEPPPKSLPSYRVEPRYIRQAHIPPQRHAVIGPWVLQHIFSPVEQNLRKQNASMRLRYPRPDARAENLDNLRARPDEYDFLASLSTSPTRTIRYDDLDSGGVSLALFDGLTLWGTDSNSRGEESKPEGESSDPTKDMVIKVLEGGASSSVPVEGSGDLPMGEASTTMGGMDGSHWTTEGAVGEEEAVMMMLWD